MSVQKPTNVAFDDVGASDSRESGAVLRLAGMSPKRLVAILLTCGVFAGWCLLAHSDDEVSKSDLAAIQPCVVMPDKFPLVTWELRNPKIQAGFELSPGILSKWEYQIGRDVTAPHHTDIRNALATSDQWLADHFDVTGIDIRCTKATLRQGTCLLEFTQYYKCVPTNLVSTIDVSGKEVVASSVRLATVTEVGEARQVLSAAEAANVMTGVFRQNPIYANESVDPESLVLRYDYCLIKQKGVDRATALVPVYRDVDDSHHIVVDAFSGKHYVEH